MSEQVNTPETDAVIAHIKRLRSTVPRFDADGGTVKALTAHARAMESRALAAEVKVPKVWDAETIKDAPEGWYYAGDKSGWWPVNGTPKTLFTKKEAMSDYGLVRRNRFFGPLPTPPKEGE